MTNPNRVYDEAVMAASVAQLLERNDSLVNIVCTGGGAGAGNDLWQVAGSSGALAAHYLPYHEALFNMFVGRNFQAEKRSYSSELAAMALAQAGYLQLQQALVEFSGPPVKHLVGVGLAATATTNVFKKGGTRVFCAVRTDTGLSVASATFDQQLFDRLDAGYLCDMTALNGLFGAVGVAGVPILPERPIHPTEPEFFDAATGLWRFQPWKCDLIERLAEEPILVALDGKVGLARDTIDPAKHVIFPGSFRRLHFAHDKIADQMKRLLGKEVVFEISAANPDKSGVDDLELARRASQLVGRWPTVLARDLPLLVDKCRAYNGCDFAVGADLAVRLLDPYYYDNDPQRVLAVLEEFSRRGSHVYVMARLVEAKVLREDQPRFVSHADLTIPERFRHVFRPLDGRWDISSTALTTTGAGH